jgi:hypothetical protein
MVVVAVLTELPYANGRRAAGPGRYYDGLVAHSDDIHGYLSFARQAAEGRWRFENRYAPFSHAPVFFNLEWLAVGKAMRWLGDPAAFRAWRLAGVMLLISGFWLLSAVLGSAWARGWVLALFCLGGGLGWMIGLGQWFLAWPPSPSPPPLDVAGYGLHPFVQMLQNPHFAVPHALVLFALAFLALGEASGRTAPYALAGVFALLACLSRPYELVSFVLVVAACHLLSGAVLDPRGLARRTLVLAMLTPALIPVRVLWSEPAFRSLRDQGATPPLGLASHLLGVGVGLVLALTSLIRDPGLLTRRPELRVLALWSLAALLGVHANRLVDAPYSTQLMVTTMGPLLLLGAPAVLGHRGGGRPTLWRMAAVAVLVLPSSAIVLRQRFEDAASPYFRYSDADRRARDWLAVRAGPGDLILAAAETGNRLPRYVSAHVFVGHWTLTPDYARRRAETEAFFAGQPAEPAVPDLVRTFGVDWIWIGPLERSLGAGRSWSPPAGCAEGYRLGGVRILRCRGALP